MQTNIASNATRRGLAFLWLLPFVIASFAALPGFVRGASFDCSRAGTSIEVTICANDTLSRLDEEVAKAYTLALRSGERPGEITEEQRRWLRDIRNKCEGEACLKAVYEERLARLTEARQTSWRRFRDTGLGIEFLYPRLRKVKKGCHGSRNCVAIMGKSMPHSDYLVAIEVFEGDLEKVAREKAVFVKKDHGWIARGRSGEYPAEPLSGPGWQGLKAIVDCGVSDTRGFHGAAGECLWAVLSDGKRSLVADTQGIAGADETTMGTIRSVRFTR